MKKIIGWAPMHLVFWSGHLVSKLMIWEPLEWLYPVYNRLMGWSVEINDWAGLSLWESVPETDGKP